MEAWEHCVGSMIASPTTRTPQNSHVSETQLANRKSTQPISAAVYEMEPWHWLPNIPRCAGLLGMESNRWWRGLETWPVEMLANCMMVRPQWFELSAKGRPETSERENDKQRQ